MSLYKCPSTKFSKTYNSWGQYLRELGTLDPNIGRSSDWSGAPSLGAALEIARNGWREGMEEVERIAAPVLAAAVADVAPTGDWTADVTGATYDVGEYLAGVPECWLSPEVEEVKPTITIGANLSVSAAISHKVITARGAAVVALVQALQAEGYPVRCYSVCGFPAGDRHEGPGTFLRVPLTDDGGGPLDVDRLAFALAHPAALRHLAFDARVMVEGRRVTGDEFQGLPYDPPEDCGWKWDLYLPSATLGERQWETVEGTREWVRKEFARLTGRAY